MAAIHAASFARGWSEAEIAALIALPTTLAMSDDHGFALLQVVPPEAEILTIALPPEMRGQGRGTALLARCLTAAAEAGVQVLTLEVDATNAAALALYRAAGFRQVALRRAYYTQSGGKRTDAIVLRCDLTAKSRGT